MIALLLITLVTYATLFFVAFLLNQQVKFVVFTLRTFSTIYDLLTWPAYLFIDKPWQVTRHSQTYYSDRHYEPNGDYTYWECKPEVSSHQQVKSSSLENQFDNVKHLSEFLPIAQRLYADLPCVGKRKVLRKIVEKGRNKFEMSSYDWLTYRQVQERIDMMTKVFHHKFCFKKGDRVALMFNTCEEWLVTFFALQSLGCEIVTLHATLGEEGICHILNSTKVEYLFTQTELVRVMNKLKPKVETVSKMINVKNPFVDQLTEEEKKNCAYELFDYDKLAKESLTLPDLNLNNNSEFSIDDVAIIMFTSGSTGAPKGVLLTHSNILQSGKSIMERIHFTINMNNEDTFLAYLPMSHIFEMICEITFYINGVKMAMGSAGTLTTGAPLLAKGCLGDVQASKVSFLTGVPLVFERIQSGIQTLLRNKSPYLAGIYNFAYEYKKRWGRRGYRCRMMNALLFKHIKEQFGGKLKLVVAGGAAMTLETQMFIKLYLDIPLVLGYASTECTGNGAISIYDEFDHANTVALMDGVKVRLEDWPEGGYSVHDKPNARGEVMIGTKAISFGYFENPDETEKAFFEENGIRWWRSGDIGAVNKYGHLSIIDRKKDLVKLKMGEYIALGKAEAVLKNCLYVENIVLNGSSYHNHLIALVQPNKANLLKLAEQLGKNTDNLEKLCEDARIRKEVTDELIKYGKSNGLMSKEVPYVIKLCPDAWTPNNGLLTATLKTRRAPIYKFYESTVNECYKELESKFPVN